MSSDEFWKDDPQLFISYRTHFINKKKREVDDIDYKCWRQGLYVYDGVGRIVLSLKQMLGNMFSSHKDRTLIEPYFSKPINILEQENKQENIKKKKEMNYKKFEENIVYFGTLKQQFLEKVKKGKE